MSIRVNLRHLEHGPVRLADRALAESFDLESRDELIRFAGPVLYDIEVRRLDQALLARGVVSVDVECSCSRCLKAFAVQLSLPKWLVHVPLQGDQAAVVENDCVDLTPYVREDILLALPQHPLCSSDCQGLLREYDRKAKASSGEGEGGDRTSPWGQLDKLDL